jgi:hypothetical protein
MSTENYTKCGNSAELQLDAMLDFFHSNQRLKNKREFFSRNAPKIENPRVGGSIPSLATINFKGLHGFNLQAFFNGRR